MHRANAAGTTRPFDPLLPSVYGRRTAISITVSCLNGGASAPALQVSRHQVVLIRALLSIVRLRFTQVDFQTSPFIKTMAGQRSPLTQLSASQQWRQQQQQLLSDSSAMMEPSDRNQEETVSQEDRFAALGRHGDGGPAARQHKRSSSAGGQATLSHSHSRSHSYSTSAKSAAPLLQTSLSLRDAAMAQAAVAGAAAAVCSPAAGPLRSTLSGVEATEAYVSPQLPAEDSAAHRRHHSGPSLVPGAALRDSCPVVHQGPQRLEAAQLRPIAKSGDRPLRDQPRPMLQISLRGSLGGRDRYGSSDAGCSPGPEIASPSTFESPSRGPCQVHSSWVPDPSIAKCAIHNTLTRWCLLIFGEDLHGLGLIVGGEESAAQSIVSFSRNERIC